MRRVLGVVGLLLLWEGLAAWGLLGGSLGLLAAFSPLFA
ncbi:ABC transporter permease, partial [Thermus scotoductus]